jgi:predicted HD superfamily hydrolase involved in NAD metabolism
MISVDQLIRILENRFDQHRYRHSLGVADEAKRLAIKEGLDGKKAYLAGLLHDYARVLTEKELQKLAVLSNWKIDNDEKSIPILLHAPVGADLVQEELKIDDQEILEAIRYHTIGSPEMGQLARIIYIADSVEPGRDFPGLDLIRKEVEKGIVPALITITSNLIKYNIDQGRLIHPNTLLLRNTCLRRMK